jgi:plasmid stability protein
MQYTIRQVPREVDAALRAKAKADGKSLNETAVAVLTEALGAKPKSKRRDLTDLIGSLSRAEAREIEKSVAAMDRADLAAQKRARK